MAQIVHPAAADVGRIAGKQGNPAEEGISFVRGEKVAAFEGDAVSETEMARVLARQRDGFAAEVGAENAQVRRSVAGQRQRDVAAAGAGVDGDGSRGQGSGDADGFARETCACPVSSSEPWGYVHSLQKKPRPGFPAGAHPISQDASNVTSAATPYLWMNGPGPALTFVNLISVGSRYIRCRGRDIDDLR